MSENNKDYHNDNIENDNVEKGEKILPWNNDDGPSLNNTVEEQSTVISEERKDNNDMMIPPDYTTNYHDNGQGQRNDKPYYHNGGVGKSSNMSNDYPLGSAEYATYSNNIGNYYDTDNRYVSINEPLYKASFGEAFLRFFKKYATFSGYASRSEFWWIQLAYFIVNMVLYIPLLMMVMPLYGASLQSYHHDQVSSVDYHIGAGSLIGIMIISAVFFVIWAATIIPRLAVTWRRLHDAGFSGLFYLLTFIPYIGAIIVAVLTALPTKIEARRPEWNDKRYNNAS